MNVDDFDYELPQERIAQHPAGRRDDARLLQLERSSGAIVHGRIRDLPRLLRPGDLLVLNDTRVFPARLVGRKPGGGKVEVLRVERVGAAGAEAGAGESVWSCIVGRTRRLRVGSRLAFGARLSGELIGRQGERWLVRFAAAAGADPEPELERLGQVPLPPYIRRPDAAAATGDRAAAELDDRARYQTVYATSTGAVAAPTAGLHFTRALLDELERSGVRIATLTLHVGPGTFQPLRVTRVEDHVMHRESFELPQATADAVGETRRLGGRIVAVGTTTVRVLEHRALHGGVVEPGSGGCELFIRPGHEFRVVDAMLTNFHLPRSTLLMLVAAFAGRRRVLAAYREAIREGYRFYSYGDAMMIGSR